MSRSALWRQEGSSKEREKYALELFESALSLGMSRERTKGVIPLRKTLGTEGGTGEFGLNPMLLGNIVKSSYFQKICSEIADWNALVDEIYYSVQNVEPWMSGT